MNYLKSEQKHIFYSILLGLFGSLVGISIFGLSGYMISLSFFEPPVFVIIIIIAVIKMFGMIKGSFKYFERLLSHDATFQMIGRLRLKYFEDTIQSSENTHSVRFIQTLNEHFERIEDYYIRIIYPYVIAVLLALLLSALSVIISWQLSLTVLLAGFASLYILPKIFETKLYSINKDALYNETSAYLKVYHHIHNNIDLFVTKRLEQSESSIMKSFNHIQDDRVKESGIESFLQFLSGIIQLAFMLVVIILMNGENSLLVPMILLLLIGFFDVANPVILPRANYKNVSSAINDVVSVKEDKDEVKSGSTIELNDVNYRYPGTKKDAISNIDITVNPGEKHVLIGSSGSGKTTILNQMIGKVEASIMPQHLDFYNATIYDNVTMFGHFTSSDKEIEKLLDYFGLGNFSPGDIIDYTGHLSGGERKRLHFVRMILERKKWWLLDEPTARLNEPLKEKMWEEIFNKETVVVSTHDLSHIDHFDMIHFVEEGQIIESGSFNDLMHKEGKTHQAMLRFADNL